jgi:hypothetical protein
MLTWLNPKTMEARLHGLLDASPQPAFSISTEDRADALKELGKALLAAERREEQLIMTAAERDQIIARRQNADPRAVMSIIVRSGDKVVAKIKKTAAA